MARISRQWERIYPATFFGLAGAVAGYLYGPQVLCVIHERQWSLENIFVAVFTLGTVAAGFGLTIYTFLLTTESCFIGMAKRSIHYKQMLTYVLCASSFSGLLSLVSIPGMVVKDAPEPYYVLSMYYALWGGLFIWTCSSLFRAAHIFSIFAREQH
jgi:hypothetical protein